MDALRAGYPAAMDEAWVEVLRTGPDAEAAVRAALTKAGIPSKATQPRLRLIRAPLRRSLEVFVPAQHEAAAREVIDAHMAEGEANIEQHLKRLPAELAVGAGVALALGGVAAALFAGAGRGWWFAALGAAALLIGRSWLRKHPKEE